MLAPLALLPLDESLEPAPDAVPDELSLPEPLVAASSFDVGSGVPSLLIGPTNGVMPTDGALSGAAAASESGVVADMAA
jgi:hypothetical protein